MQKKLGENYKWVVLAGCALVLMCYFGIVNNCYSIYIIPVCDDLGFSRSQYTLIQSIYYGCVMIMSLFAARIFERFGTLRVFRLSCLFIMFFYCLNGFVSSLPVFYAIGIVNGFLMGLNCVVPTTFIIKQWFKDNIGFAIGLAQAMSGVGGVVFNQVAKKILLVASWRQVYIYLGLILGICGIFATNVLIKEKDEESNNVHIKTLAEEKIPEKPEVVNVNWGITLPIMICLGLLTFSHNGVMYTATPYVQDIGYSMEYGANISSIAMGAFAIGKILFGIIVDKIGIGKATVLSGLGIIIGNIGMLLFPLLGSFAIPLMCMSIGFGSPYSTIGVSILPNLLGKGYEKRATSLYIAGVNIGCSTLPVISSLVFDNLGSYTPLYYADICLCALQLCIMISVIRKHGLTKQS